MWEKTNIILLHIIFSPMQLGCLVTAWMKTPTMAMPSDNPASFSESWRHVIITWQSPDIINIYLSLCKGVWVVSWNDFRISQFIFSTASVVLGIKYQWTGMWLYPLQIKSMNIISHRTWSCPHSQMVSHLTYPTMCFPPHEAIPSEAKGAITCELIFPSLHYMYIHYLEYHLCCKIHF